MLFCLIALAAAGFYYHTVPMRSQIVARAWSWMSSRAVANTAFSTLLAGHEQSSSAEPASIELICNICFA